MISIDAIKKMNKEELTEYAIHAHFLIDTAADYIEELKDKINVLEQQIDVEKSRYTAGLQVRTCKVVFDRFCGEMQEKYFPDKVKDSSERCRKSIFEMDWKNEEVEK